jgi:hypothetical protein
MSAQFALFLVEPRVGCDEAQRQAYERRECDYRVKAVVQHLSSKARGAFTVLSRTYGVAPFTAAHTIVTISS